VCQVVNSLQDYLLRVISGQKKGFVSTLICLLLSVLEILYLIIINIRYFVYNTGIKKSKKLPCKVISIGNITAGGTGKTPLVKLVAEVCKEKHLSTVIINSGYKAENTEARIVYDGEKMLVSEEEAGDEALMLSQLLSGVPVITGKDRYLAGKLALEEFTPELILLDDGFQHWQLARDKDIVLIDASNPFAYRHLLPRGLLREPLKALKRADLFLITKVNSVEKEKLVEIIRTIKKHNMTTPIFTAKYESSVLRIYQKNGEIKLLPAESLNGKKVLAFSGIGNPTSFQKSLEECGGEILFHYKYPDHYQYTRSDIEEMTSWAARDSSQRRSAKRVDMIITTEKDLVKIDKEMRSLIIAEYNLAVLEIEVKIDKKEEFLNLL